MIITLNKALKLKNKLVGNISKLAGRMQTSNSYAIPNTPVYNSRDIMKQYFDETEKLIKLKVAINEGNRSIIHLIARIPELKSRISVLQGMDVTSGQRTQSYREAVVVQYTAVIPEAERDSLIEQTQEELEKVQDDIDKYNATVTIEVDF